MALQTLVVHSGAMGDFVLMLGVVQALREKYGGPIGILGRASYSNIAGETAGVDRFLTLDSGEWHTLFGESPERGVEALVRAGIPARIIDALGISDVACARLKDAGVRTIVRLETRPTGEVRRHIIEEWCDALQTTGLMVEPSPPRIDAPNDDVAQAVLDRVGIDPAARANLAIIHIGSGGERKCWPIESFIALTSRFSDFALVPIILVGPVELERVPLADWKRRICERVNIVADPSLSELKALLATCRVFVGNDSGVGHLAAAMRRPTVAIFGATDPVVWRPLGSNVRVVGELNRWPSVEDIVEALEQLHD